MIGKLTKLTTRVLATLFAVFATSSAWADFTNTNPVTGETENYTWKFVGTDTWNGTGNWQDSSEANPSGTPAKSGENTWDPILFDGNTINITASMSVEGWNLRMGLYNGASVTMNNFVKYQGDTTMWMTVDETSQLNIGGFGGGNITDGQVIKLSVAKSNGITWNVGLTSGNANNTFEYYLKGAGSVSYQAVTAANHKIKMADVTLTGTSQVSHKTLVSFTSSSQTFTADAAIKVLDSNGDRVATKALSTVNTTGTTTLTTDNTVGTCELVQTSTGIDLYWVDGDPANLPAATVYKPSININFTNGAGNGLTTSADVGLDGYAVPGTSWNNFVVANNATFNTVNAIDSTGAASVASGVSVSISGTRGHWNCSNLTPASNPLHGYIDESAGGPTPTVTITGIPYEHYRVIVYHSTDQDGAQFGYDTINGFNFTYVDGVQTEGTTSWGNAGASNSAEPIGEGTNTLVSAVLSGDTVTMVAHRIGGGSPSARGCFAAIQVVEYVPEVSENDLEIAVDGATEYGVTETKNLSGTVYLTGSGTLTLTGSEKITAATIDVAKDVVLNINADRLDATTFTGAGTVVYDTTVPVEGKGWANIGWSGTVWIKNQSVSSFEGTKFGNAGSTVRFTGVTGFLQTSSWSSSTYVHTVPLELVDEGNTIAFTYNNGWGGNLVKINTLKGTGTLYTYDRGSGEHIYIVDASGFSGVFNLTCKYVYVGGSQPDYSASTNPNGKLEIRSGVTMTVPADKTWTANGGFVVNGTLNVDGTLASSHATKAVSGSGTVVFAGKLPSPTGDTWWKNSDWDGTVQIASVTDLVGGAGWSGSNFLPNDYGNSESVLELKNCSGWLPNDSNYLCTVPLKVTGTLTINNGISGNKFVISKLLGDGAIYTTNNGATTTIQVLSADDFTGYVNLNSKRVIFGDTIPATFTAGQIYVGSGFSFTVPNSDAAWYGTGGITLDGELKAKLLSNFGGGTTITTTDNGVFTFINSDNTQDQAIDYARITGTGTLRYADVSGKWRTLSRVNFPTGMICENNLSEGLILQAANTEHVIGSLAGSGSMRSDWGGSQNVGDRSLKILQAKDTVYSGLFHSDDRITTVTVAPGTTTAGTLTLSNTQTVSNDLAIESGAAVNLTGTWKGATTVSGTFGGTGTLTGNLTFNAGSTFKAYASDENGLSVSGTVAYPEEGTVTVDVDALGSPESDVVLISKSGLDGNKFTLKAGTPAGYTLAVEGDALKLKTPAPVAITVPTVEHTTVTVTANGEPVEGEDGVYSVPYGSAVVVTYTAEEGYELSGTPTYNIASATSDETIDASGTTVAQYQAAVVDTEGTAHYYPTAQAAVDAVDSYRGMGAEKVYSYFAVFFGTDVAITVDLSKMSWATFNKPIKFKCSTGATVSVAPSSVEYELIAGEPDENGIVTYEKSPKATTYFWAGTGSTAQAWGRPALWKVDSAEGDTATRAPSTLDTVAINGGAPISGAGGVTVAAIQVSGTAVVSGDGTLTATSGGIVLTDAAATLTVTGVTLSPTPTTNVSRSRVKTVTADGTTTYSVEAIPGTLFSVY